MPSSCSLSLCSMLYFVLALSARVVWIRNRGSLVSGQEPRSSSNHRRVPHRPLWPRFDRRISYRTRLVESKPSIFRENTHSNLFPSQAFLLRWEIFRRLRMPCILWYIVAGLLFAEVHVAAVWSVPRFLGIGANFGSADSRPRSIYIAHRRILDF